MRKNMERRNRKINMLRFERMETGLETAGELFEFTSGTREGDR